jgi:integrase
MALTDTAARHAKPAKKAYVLSDGLGLSLYVPPSGSRYWSFRFSWQGKQSRISLGTYPEVGLKEARSRRDTARELIAKGIDPRQMRRAERQQAAEGNANSFKAVANRWHAFWSKSLTPGKKGSGGQCRNYLDKDLLPVLGHLPISSISRLDVLEAIRRVEKRGALVSASKCRTWLNHIFRYAMAQGLVQSNPAADLDIVAEPTLPVRHNPFLRLGELSAFLIKLRAYPGAEGTRLGVRLLLLTGVRTGELRAATVEQFDLINKVWNVPAEGVKQLRNRVRTESGEIPPYIVPLSSQALEIVEHLINIRLPCQAYLLPHRSEPRSKISENTLNNAIRRIGYVGKLTGHGLRGTISTALNEMGFDRDWVEAQLSHAESNKARAAYNHAEYVAPRRQMMQYWADLLDAVEHGRSIPNYAASVPVALSQMTLSPRAEIRRISDEQVPFSASGACVSEWLP